MKHPNDQILFSKVFLIGEYSACQYGRGILICHAPTFKFQLSHTYPQDALMEKVTKEFPVLKHYGLQISAPHKDLGGFGQSSATFRAIANVLNEWGVIHPTSINEWYEWYLQFTWPTKKGLQPSGLDFIAQTVEGCQFIDRDKDMLQPCNWLVEHFGIVIAHMKHKVTTHQHLATISSQNSLFQPLDQYTHNAYHAIQTKNPTDLLHALEQFQTTIRTLGLEHPNTLECIQQLKKLPNILHARGCGALGADVILILTPKDQCQIVAKSIQNMSYFKHIYTPFC